MPSEIRRSGNQHRQFIREVSRDAAGRRDTLRRLSEGRTVSMLGFFIAWGNVPFTIAAGIALVFATLQMTGVLGLLAGDSESDADHDVDGGHDVDADHDVDGAHDADADHDADHDADDGTDHDADGRGFGDLVWGPLGLGRIPFSIIWQTYAMVFAGTGLALNARVFWRSEGGPPVYSLFWTVPASLVAGYVAVALVARFLGPVLASKLEQATSRAELVGQIGVVISSKVTAEFGEVRIHDKTGHDLRIVCRLAEGQKPPSEHAQVVVVEYEPTRGELFVAPLEQDEPASPPARRSASG